MNNLGIARSQMHWILSLFVLRKIIPCLWFRSNADRAGELPKLVEDLLQTSISTGPRGAFRFAQGIQAVLGVGGEWLNDFSKVISCLCYSSILSKNLILEFLRTETMEAAVDWTTNELLMCWVGWGCMGEYWGFRASLDVDFSSM